MPSFPHPRRGRNPSKGMALFFSSRGRGGGESNETTEREERVKNIVVFLGSFDGTKGGLENSFDHFPRNFFHSRFGRR